MSVTPAFGPLRSAADVEAAVLARLQDCAAAYIAEVAGQADRTLPGLRGIVTVSEFAKWPEDQLPCAVVVSPGTVDTEKDADGTYNATYSVAVGVVVGARSEADTRTLAQLYGAAVRGALIQRRGLTSEITVLSWNGESLDDLPVADRRSLLASVNLFTVELRGLANWKVGPADCDPIEPDAAPWTADVVTPEVEAVPAGEELA